MGNCGSNNDTVESAVSPRTNQPTRAPPAQKENKPTTLSAIKEESIAPQKTKYKLIYFDFTGRAEVIR